MNWYDRDNDTVNNAVFLERMDELLEAGMSQRKAALVLASECPERFNMDNLRMRYQYWNKQREQSLEHTDIMGELSSLRLLIELVSTWIHRNIPSKLRLRAAV